MPSSLVHDAGLLRARQCSPIRELFIMNAPVVVHYFVPYSANAVCFVHFQISIVPQNNVKSRQMATLEAKYTSCKSPKLLTTETLTCPPTRPASGTPGSGGWWFIQDVLLTPVFPVGRAR
jgi:hypothetical protein